MRICKHCGFANEEEVKFCHNCGIALVSEGAADVPPPTCPRQQPPHPGQLLPPGSGYAPAIPVTYAGFWIRFVAAFIDGIILSFAFLPLNIVLRLLSREFILFSWGYWQDGSHLAIFLLNLLRLLLSWAYFTYMTGRYQYTIGKKLLNLKVIGEDMGPISYGTAAVREIVGKFISGIVCLLGYIWAGFDERKQAWHDKIASTYVIREA